MKKLNPLSESQLPIDERCKSTKVFKTIGLQSLVLALNTLGVALFPCL